MDFFLQIIGNSDDLSHPSFFLSLPSQSFLFNSSEGFQRLLPESNVKFSKIQNIFFTRLEHDRMSGIPGQLLSVALGLNDETGPKYPNLHGPPNLYHHLMSLSQITWNRLLVLGVNEYPNSTTFSIPTKLEKEKEKEKENEKVEVIKFTTTLLSFDNETNNNSQQTNLKKTIDLSNTTELLKVYNELGKAQKQPLSSLAYIIELPPKKGSLNVQKARQLGIKNGKKFGLLKKGVSVKTPDGKVVNPEDCVNPDTPGIQIAIIDLYDKRLLDSLLTNEIFSDYCSKEEKENSNKKLGTIFYWIDNEILLEERFKEWISRFDGQTSHVFVTLNNSSILPSKFPNYSSFIFRNQLNLIDKDIFPLDISNNLKWAQKQVEEQNQVKKQLKINPKLIHFGYNKFKMNLGPKKIGICVPEDQNKKEREEKTLIQKFGNKLNEKITIDEKEIDFQEFISDFKNLLKNDQLKQLFHEILFLGTGSALPSKYRNVTGILIKVDSTLNILLDAGEGTFGQLLLNYDLQTMEVLLNIQLIWISHVHADHHLGLIKVLKMRENYYKKKFGNLDGYQQPLIIGPPDFIIYWNHIIEITDELVSFKTFTHDQFSIMIQEYKNNNSNENKNNSNINNNNKIYTEELSLNKGLFSCFDDIIQVEMIHCKDSKAIVLIRNGLKLVYSGDGRPNEELIKHGIDAQILIHEATFDKDEQELATKKDHSTITEAIEVADQMNAKYTILTHLSQRYSKNSFEFDTDKKIIISYDFMTITPSNVEKATKLSPLITQLFITEVKNNQQKDGKKKKNKKQRTKKKK
ncbi:zinc phosphodiesterase elac protein [Anaeramoeba flamelloides]|uniref:ribonuclease Z n=1 Tax=Anaeramoeba flamelloides TaxID=1746091 RepID=A0AAV7ZXV0_9EUKA|nr:zinc phosphodiesterase elac protein [Anaeramoeba flamelloides]